VTGQQVGLFGGPLYTVYKAMTALRLAQELAREGLRAVPVFWMDTDDHDLAEITRVNVLDDEGRPRTLDCRHSLFGGPAESSGSVGGIELPAAIVPLVEEFVGYFDRAPGCESVRDCLRSTYRPGSTFSASFASLMTRLFRGTGLVLFDPRDPAAKRLVAPIMERAVERAGPLTGALIERGQALERAGFRPQVSVHEDSTLLFLDCAGARRSVVARDGGFLPKGLGDLFTAERLRELAREQPERFSPNVLLRPITQDHLFPTVAYVGGPAEIGYFAQVEVLYRDWGRPMPVVWPRSSVSVLDQETRSVMRRHGIAFQDCLGERALLADKIARTGPTQGALELVGDLRRRTERTLDEVGPSLQRLDPTLVQALGTVRRKAARNLSRMEGRIRRAETSSGMSAEREADWLLNRCRPLANLQERELTVWQLVGRFGPSVLDAICASLKLDQFTHLVLDLESAE
jgi:bacillithiol biosynthesis cysteine-adding enzyme BshC